MAMDMCEYRVETVERDLYEAGVQIFLDGLNASDGDCDVYNVFYLTGYLNAGLALNQYNELMEVAA